MKFQSGTYRKSKKKCCVQNESIEQLCYYCRMANACIHRLGLVVKYLQVQHCVHTTAIRWRQTLGMANGMPKLLGQKDWLLLSKNAYPGQPLKYKPKRFFISMYSRLSRGPFENRFLRRLTPRLVFTDTPDQDGV